MSAVTINDGIVELKLTLPRSLVRICDEHGNHIAKPASTRVNFNSNYVEWMIRNNQLMQIIDQKFTERDKQLLLEKLKTVSVSLRDSNYYSRAAQKQIINERLGNFSIYKYEEVFYSFENSIDPGLKVRVTFKWGDFTLAAHMFVLIQFNCPDIELQNKRGHIRNNEILGSGAKCIWNPSKEKVSEIAKALAHSSEQHKNDLINLLGVLIKQ